MEQEYIVIAFTENQIGVLNRITGLYLRRKINIESLKVSESSIKGISMFVISAFTTHEIIERLVKQLRNIIDVIQVEFYSNEELITQEIALYKISAEILRQSDTVDRIIRQWNARFIEINPAYVVVEKTGMREEIDRMRKRSQRRSCSTNSHARAASCCTANRWKRNCRGKYRICKPGKSAHRFDPVSPAACKRMPLRFRQADRGTGPFKVWTNKEINQL
ncbi:MAG: acetolactate synthase small subunit [Alistipes indistinctus]